MASKLLASLIPACLLAACSLGTINTSAGTEDFGGLVVGDEPLAVRAGADMLAAGGSAADAAAATYFTLAVTYPVAAGLGGGGICLVRDTAKGRADSIDFLPRNVRSGGLFAVPGNVRGFALLQSLYGRQPWQSVVAPGERLAMLGFPMSRALAERVAGSANVVRLDAGLARVFMDESGNMHREGDVVRNPDLGNTLTAIRTGGPSTLYEGKLASTLMAYAAGQHDAIAPDELANYTPTRVAAHVAAMGDETVFLPAERTGAGKLAASVFARLAARSEAILSADVAAAVTETLKGYGVGALPNDLGATGFAAVDRDGQAVACAVTMSGPFGSGRTAEGTGVTFAAAPSMSNVGMAVAFLMPALAADGEDGLITLAGAGAGGPDATAAMLAAAALRAERETIGKSIESSAAAKSPLQSVNLIACDSGACRTLADPGAHGMGATAGGQ